MTGPQGPHLVAAAEPPTCRCGDRIAEALRQVLDLAGTRAEPLLMTVEQAAARLGVSERWLAEEAAAKRVPHTKLGRHTRFAPRHLDAVIVAYEVAAELAADPLAEVRARLRRMAERRAARGRL